MTSPARPSPGQASLSWQSYGATLPVWVWRLGRLRMPHLSPVSSLHRIWEVCTRQNPVCYYLLFLRPYKTQPKVLQPRMTRGCNWHWRGQGPGGHPAPGHFVLWWISVMRSRDFAKRIYNSCAKVLGQGFSILRYWERV